MCVSCSSSFLPLFWDGCFIRVVLLIITALYTRVYQMHKIAVKSIGCVSTPGFEKKCEKCQLLLGKLTPINDIRSFFDDLRSWKTSIARQPEVVLAVLPILYFMKGNEFFGRIMHAAWYGCWNQSLEVIGFTNRLISFIDCPKEIFQRISKSSRAQRSSCHLVADDDFFTSKSWLREINQQPGYLNEILDSVGT